MGKVDVHRLHQLSLGANALKEHDELQFEENEGINRRAPHEAVVGILDQVIHKAEIEFRLQLLIEMTGWNQFFKRQSDVFLEAFLSATEHRDFSWRAESTRRSVPQSEVLRKSILFQQAGIFPCIGVEGKKTAR